MYLHQYYCYVTTRAVSRPTMPAITTILSSYHHHHRHHLQAIISTSPPVPLPVVKSKNHLFVGWLCDVDELTHVKHIATGWLFHSFRGYFYLNDFPYVVFPLLSFHTLKFHPLFLSGAAFANIGYTGKTCLM